MSEPRIDADVVRWAVDGRPASSDAAIAALGRRPLLLLLHGYGSFEGDLVELAPQLPAGLVCASLRAPLVAPPPVVDGYAWWRIPVPGRAAPDAAEERGPALAVLTWLDRLDADVAAASADGTGIGDIALMGFSQGGAMVTSLLRLRPGRFACGVSCSGFLAPGSYPGDAELVSIRPPLFWGRDVADPIIDPARIEAMQAWAPVHTELEARRYPGIAHSIGREELADVSAFLARRLPEIAA